jgi:hypothetical protein
MKQCHVCDGRCTPEVHASSLRIRAWLRARLELAMQPARQAGPRSEHFRPSLLSIKDARSPASKRKAAQK